MKKFLKPITIFTLAAFLWCLPCQKAEAVVMPPAMIGAGALGALLVTAATVAYYKPASFAGSTHFVSPLTGSFFRVAMAAYNQLNQFNQNNLFGKLVAAKAGYDNLKNKVKDNKDTYPTLYSHLTRSTALTYADYYNSVKSEIVGKEIYLADGTCHKLGALYSSKQDTVIWTDSSPATEYNKATLVTGKIRIRHITSTGPRPGFPADNHISTFDEAYYYDAGLATPSKRDATVAEFSSSIAPSGAVTDTAAQNEFDNIIANDSSFNVISFVDTVLPDNDKDTAPVYAPPAGASVLPQEVTPATGLGAQTAATAAAASQAANSNLAAAKSAYDDAKAAYDASATPENLAALQAAEQALTEAQQAAQAAANSAAQAKAEEEATYPGVQTEDFKTLDFSKWLQLKNCMANVWPFTLLTSLAGLYSQLVSDPVAPSFDVPMPLDHTMHIDLSCFDTVALISRWTITLLLSIGGVYYLVRFWRGVS